jgi:hypothetical protein
MSRRVSIKNRKDNVLDSRFGKCDAMLSKILEASVEVDKLGLGDV